MTVQEIHEYIWNGIIHALKSKKLKYKRMYIHNIKISMMRKLYSRGKISIGAYNLLLKHNCCVLCAVYNEWCHCCPLKGCGTDAAIYARVTWLYDIEGARAIRNVDVLSGNDYMNKRIANNMQHIVKVLESLKS